jgi:hypothetical protein
MAIDSKNLLVWVKAMSRGQALPLDASEVHGSMTEAEAYAATATAYAGQTIKVKLDDGKYHLYTLQPSSSGLVLEEISVNVEDVPTGGVDFETDDTLTLENGILSVNTTDKVESDNTLPITSAGVHATVGNIDALLQTI